MLKEMLKRPTLSSLDSKNFIINFKFDTVIQNQLVSLYFDFIYIIMQTLSYTKKIFFSIVSFIS